MLGHLLGNHMAKKNIHNFIQKIISHPGVILTPMGKDAFHISLGCEKWYVWPRRNLFKPVGANSYDEAYHGDIKHFYNRFIKKSVDLPKNFGKFWGKSEDELLIDMALDGQTVNRIAQELQRHPKNVVERYALLTADNSIVMKFSADMYDVALNEFS